MNFKKSLVISSLMSFSAFLLFIPPAFSESLTVKEIKGKLATAEGSVKDLKSGDYLYFHKSPFRFRIEKVSDNSCTIQIPPSSEISIGSSLLIAPTEAIKKSLVTEDKLKDVLAE